jgi:threonine/homoserine efflux transporter RhtA
VSAAFWAVVEPPWSFPWHRPDDQVAVGGALSEATLPQGVLVAWVVVLETLIPFALLLSALHALPAARVTLLSTWEPLAAAIVAWAWLSERLSGTQVGAQRSSSPAS